MPKGYSGRTFDTKYVTPFLKSVLGTASGYQLLIYIPHFSIHIIQLIAEPLRIMPALAAQDPMMVAAVAAVISASVLVLVFRGRIKNKQSPLMIVN